MSSPIRAINRKRSIQDCRKFKKFFDKPKGITRVVNNDASTYDTMRFISQVTKKDIRQVQRYANYLKSLNLPLRSLCKVVWNDLFGCVDYQLDEPGKEQVRTPERLIHDAVGDCDCYTRFLVAVFTALNLPIIHRKTDYGMGWQHVYVIVPTRRNNIFDPNNPTKEVLHRSDYIVIDPVAKKFDYEKPFQRKFDAMSVLQSLEGINTPMVLKTKVPFSTQFEIYSKCIPTPTLAQSLSGDLHGDLGLLKKLRQKIGNTVKSVGKGIGKGVSAGFKAVKTVGGKVIQTVNRFVNPVTILLRNGLLLGMKLNIFGVAEKLRWAYLPDEKLKKLVADGRIKFSQSDLDKIKTAQRKLHNTFKAAGGKSENIVKAVLNGKGNKDKKVTLDGLGNLSLVRQYADANEKLITETPWQHLDTLSLIPLEYETEDGTRVIMDGEGRFFSDGLNGEPISTGAAIAAATAALKVLAEILKSARQPEIQEAIPYDQSVVSEIDALPFDSDFLVDDGQYDFSTVQVPDNLEPIENRGGDDDDKGGNTALYVAGGLAVLGIGYMIYKNSQSKKTLSGIEDEDEPTPRTRTKRRKKVKKRKRKPVKDFNLANL